MTRVALIDDHAIFCDSLTSLVNDFEEFTVAWSANDGKKAIGILQAESDYPDIILLDIVMPGISGLDVARWIFEHKKNIKVLALTMEEDDNNVIQMLQYGVKGYLLKSMGAEELQVALKQVVKFGYYYTPIITSNIHKQVERRMFHGSIPELTAREKELLHFLCSDRSYAEIAKSMILSESTVDTHRARLFEKFEVKNRVSLILKAFNSGLVKL